MEQKVKLLIIDDEPPARELVKNYLKQRGDIDMVGECENGFDGIKKIQELQPDILLLDVQMPKLNGFEMLELLDEIPEVIFITAHNEFAIQAFELNATDYLLKPFAPERLMTALDKAIARVGGKGGAEKIKALIREPLAEKLERIVVKSGIKIHVIPVQKINYLEAQDDYVMIYTDEGKHLKQATMKFFEDNLNPSLFVRVHRSYMVRVEQVVQIEPWGKDSYMAKLKNGTLVKMSKGGLKQLKVLLHF